jgi:uncharacterized protein
VKQVLLDEKFSKAQLTMEILAYIVSQTIGTKRLQEPLFSCSRGNDLVTPQAGFPRLKEGDRWCLCVTRCQEALEAGVAPPVDLEAKPTPPHSSL